MEFTGDAERLFTFDVEDPDGNTVYTLEAHDELFKARYPAGMSREEKYAKAVSLPYPVYDGFVYRINQLAVILAAYSESEFERFLEAYEKEGGECITRSQTT